MIRAFGLAVAAAGLVLSGALTLTLAGAGPLSSHEKPSERDVSEKGTPLPSQSSGKPDGWLIVPPEERTDISFVDVEDAQLFLPGPDDAANCDDGKLDAEKATTAIRDWLAENKSEMPFVRVWDQTLILVVCQYPSDNAPGKVQLNIGIPNGGYSYVAPESCAEQMRGVPAGADLPASCILPDDVVATPDSWRGTILVDPSEVLR